MPDDDEADASAGGSGGPPPDERVCQGTLLAAGGYLSDVEERGYKDARLGPNGTMTPEQVAVWTEGVMNGK